MAKVQPAFTAKFRVVDNTNPANDYAPEKNVIFDFTAENALKAAEFFMKMHDKAEKEGTTIRVYTDKNQFHEEAGFTLWGGMWGNSGRIQPMPHKDASERTVDVQANQPELPDDLPF